MSAALRSVGLLDVLSSTSAGPSVARLVSTPVCAASLRNPVRNSGEDSVAKLAFISLVGLVCLGVGQV